MPLSKRHLHQFRSLLQQARGWSFPTHLPPLLLCFSTGKTNVQDGKGHVAKRINARSSWQVGTKVYMLDHFIQEANLLLGSLRCFGSPLQSSLVLNLFLLGNRQKLFVKRSPKNEWKRGKGAQQTLDIPLPSPPAAIAIVFSISIASLSTTCVLASVADLATGMLSTALVRRFVLTNQPALELQL